MCNRRMLVLAQQGGSNGSAKHSQPTTSSLQPELAIFNDGGYRDDTSDLFATDSVCFRL